MAHEISWLVENYVVQLRIYGPIDDLEEVREIEQSVLTLLQDCPNPVHVVINALDVERLPKNILEARQFLRRWDGHELGWMLLVIKTNPLLRYMAVGLMQLVVTNIKLRMFGKTEDALRFLNITDPKLNLLQPHSESSAY